MIENENLMPDQPEEETQAVEQEVATSKKAEYDESLFENSTIFGAAAHQTKKRKLTPMMRGLVISGIALLTAGAVLTTVLLIPKKDQGGTTSSAASVPTYTVTAFDEGKLDTVQVFNAIHPEGFTLVKEEVKAESTTSSASKPTYNWLVQGFEKYDLSGAKYLVQSVVALTSSKKYAKSASTITADDIDVSGITFNSEAPQKNDNDIYGFLNPYSVIVLKGTDLDKTVIVGNSAPDNSGRYVTVTGMDDVYVVSESKMAYYDSSYNDMIGLLVNDYILENEGTADYYSDGALAKIDKVVLGGSCRKKLIRIESPPDDLSVLPFVVTEPVFRAGDEESISLVMSVATTGLNTDGAYKLGYTNGDLTKYGLANPYSTLEIAVGSYHVKLSFGTLQEDGYYPCIKEGSDIIYKVAAEGNEWIEYEDTDLYYDTLFLEYITGIDSIQVTTDKKDATFELIREDPEKKNVYTIKCDQAKKGVTIDSKQLNFYYGRILDLATEEFLNEAYTPTEDAYITITIDYTDSSRTNDVIKLYKYSTRRYYYTLNDKGNSLVSANSVKDLYNCLGTLLEGKEIGRK